MNIGINMAPLLKGKNITGIGTYVINVLARILENDNSNDYFLISNGDLSVDFPNKSNVHYVQLKCPSSYVFSRYYVIKEILGKKIDVYWTTTQALPLLKPKKTRYCMTIYDIANLKNVDFALYRTPRQKLFKYVTGVSLKKADDVFAISEATKEDLIDVFKVHDASKIHVIYLGNGRFSGNITDEALNRFGIKQPYILYVGTLQPRKNIKTIVEGFIRFRENEKGIQLVLAGGKGWGMEEVIEEIKNSDVKDDIVMTGFVSEEDKQCLYKNAACVAFPSLYEGFGIPVLEAFEYGLPVITAKNSSLPEVGGDAAFYLDNEKSSEEMANMLERVMHFSDEERASVKKKDENQLQKFNWDKCAKETHEILIGDNN